jgi:peroxiredoxin
MPNCLLKSVLLCLSVLLGCLCAAEVPRRSPEFVVNTVNGGGPILLSSYHGKVVALMFILTTCPHCQHTTQIMTEMQKEFGPRGFQVLGASIEDMAKLTVPGFVQQFQPAFPVGYADRSSVQDFLQHPAQFIMMMPQVVFIDRQGVIRKQVPGDDPFFAADQQEKNIRETIEGLVKEGTAQRKVAARKKS